MTIQEAIKSGKPFKRPWHLDWLFITPSGCILIDTENGESIRYYLDKESILADDWEVKQ